MGPDCCYTSAMGVNESQRVREQITQICIIAILLHRRQDSMFSPSLFSFQKKKKKIFFTNVHNSHPCQARYTPGRLACCTYTTGLVDKDLIPIMKKTQININIHLEKERNIHLYQVKSMDSDSSYIFCKSSTTPYVSPAVLTSRHYSSDPLRLCSQSFQNHRLKEINKSITFQSHMSSRKHRQKKERDKACIMF